MNKCWEKINKTLYGKIRFNLKIGYKIKLKKSHLTTNSRRKIVFHFDANESRNFIKTANVIRKLLLQRVNRA